jgi:hypothetical protein
VKNIGTEHPCNVPIFFTKAASLQVEYGLQIQRVLLPPGHVMHTATQFWNALIIYLTVSAIIQRFI